MSYLNKIFQNVPVKIPDRSGFDLSNEHLFDAPIGTLIPAKWIEVLPGDTISLGNMTKVTLPPFAVPFMGRVDACLEAFFVPFRQVWKGWESFITANNGIMPSVLPSSQQSGVPLTVPTIDLSSVSQYGGACTLSDYLGLKFVSQQPENSLPPISALPWLCYHKIVDDWYRDENNMKPFFMKNPAVPSSLVDGAVAVRFSNSVNLPLGGSAAYATSYPLGLPSSTPGIMANLVDTTIGLGSLRQRCWAKDYFTTATTRPQAGAAASITFDTSGTNGNITVSALRQANSLQKWMERNSISGTRYASQILAHFGVTPPSATIDEAILLGSNRFPIYVGSVENHSAAVGGDQNTKNPYENVLGSAAGFGSGAGKDRLVDDFTAKEHGIIMVMFSIVPHAYYEMGYDRNLRHVTFGDFPWPEFSNVGDQPIEYGELYPTDVSTGGVRPSDAFGYNQRYSEAKHSRDVVSGLLRSGFDLDVYALKRTFGSLPELGKSFLEINDEYLNDVFAVSNDVATSIVDCYFDCRVLRVLPEYSLPSL